MGKEEVTQIVEGVLIRSRIKPTPESWYKNLYLEVNVAWLFQTRTLYYSVNVTFGRFDPKPPTWGQGGHNSGLGIGPDESLKALIKSSVEKKPHLITLKSTFWISSCQLGTSKER